MTKAERQRVGSRLKALRAERNWTQQYVAKKAGVALGTLRTIEKGTREAHGSNLAKVAEVFGKHAADLLRPLDAIDQGDPRLAGLIDEDLKIARAYHDAGTHQRLHVRALLLKGESDRLTHLITLLLDANAATLENVEAFVTGVVIRRDTEIQGK